MKRKLCLSLFVVCGLLAALGGGLPVANAEWRADGTILYVDWEATGANDGSSWEDAFTALQPALEAALEGDQIWVAAGTYYPSVEVGGVGDRYKTFQMRIGVGIYGGFDPTVGDVGWDDRDWVANEVILSGDIGTAGNYEDNSYHVFFHPAGTDLDGTAVLDGFKVMYGFADGTDDHDSGGGMFNTSSSPTLSNCTFEFNEAGGDEYGEDGFGAAMYNEDSSPTLTSCTLHGNRAGHLFSRGFGAGMYNTNSSPTLTECSFVSNEAGYFENGEGGGMANVDSSPTLTDCTFVGNGATGAGGGMLNINSSPVLTDCLFEGNHGWGYTWFSGYGAGMFNGSNSLPALIRCVFANNDAYGEGGGMLNSNSSPMLTDCIFEENEAEMMGGGMSNWNGAPMLTNCIFVGNYSWDVGGGMYNDGSSPVLTNCVFSGNEGYFGGGGIHEGSPTLTNSVLWGDIPDEIDGTATAAYSDIQGGYAGEGNIDADPLWVDPANGDYHLTAASPCIDAGSNDAPNLPPFDFEGDERIIDGDEDGLATVDMGVDEFVVPITGLEATNDGPTPIGQITTLEATIDSGSEVTYTWAFGDGSFGSGWSVSHVYPAVGEYTAVVTAANSVSLQEATTTVFVYVRHTVCLPIVCRDW